VHFARQSQRLRRELRELLRRGWTSLAIGLVFLGASVIGGAVVRDERRIYDRLSQIAVRIVYGTVQR
jgi:hypothetical protein